jgi:hypothetical protein
VRKEKRQNKREKCSKITYEKQWKKASERGFGKESGTLSPQARGTQWMQKYGASVLVSYAVRVPPTHFKKCVGVNSAMWVTDALWET